jgi:hypothetical protein
VPTGEQPAESYAIARITIVRVMTAEMFRAVTFSMIRVADFCAVRHATINPRAAADQARHSSGKIEPLPGGPGR